MSPKTAPHLLHGAQDQRVGPEHLLVHKNPCWRQSPQNVVTSENLVLCRKKYGVTSDNVVLCRQKNVVASDRETFEQFLCYKSKSFRHESLSEFHPVVEEELKTKA
ncbi:hypothetical protein DPMN_081773 [Dreissena polymorpha]|uniref:Uncharacterized protein n=1 Tax=Dreissena polymorpha TaxID=45954 RepID=A0A9D3Y5N2_DREPO|nr:hypothetical protein DPMN_081773 [Dreissena polymorpha]